MEPTQKIPTCRNIAAFLLVSLFFCAAALASSSSDGSLQTQQKDLKAVRARIEALRKELSTNESARRKAQEEVRQTEAQILQLQQELNALSSKRSALEQRLAEIKRQSDDLSVRIRAQQSQLEHTLFRQYVAGSPDPLQNLLNGENPAEAGRASYYVTQVAQSRTDLLTAFRQDLATKKQLSADLEARTAELKTLLAQQKQKQAELLKHRDRRQELVAALSGKLEKQKQEISSLQQSEKRLSALVDRLIAQIAAREKRAADSTRNHHSPGQNTPQPPPRNPALTGLPPGLKLPVQGMLAGRFGAPREEGGKWKGILIRANRGTPVKAIATGEVVYADFMRGFGNLLILDHGNGYLSIYGNNDTLTRRTGDTVKNGETIATVGSSGPDQESGLYLEIRHQGQPLDPLKWASSR